MIRLGEEGHGESKVTDIHIQQPVKPVDNIANYGFYRASICINPGQTAIILNSKLADRAFAILDYQDTTILKHRETQIIKN